MSPPTSPVRATRPKPKPKALVWMPMVVGEPPAHAPHVQPQAPLPSPQAYQSAWTGTNGSSRALPEDLVNGGSTVGASLGLPYPRFSASDWPSPVPVAPTYNASPPTSPGAHPMRGASARPKTRPSPMGRKPSDSGVAHPPGIARRPPPQSSSVLDVESLSPGNGLVGISVPVPLPRDVDPSVFFPVRMNTGAGRGNGQRGLRPALCPNVTKEMPSTAIMDGVQGSSACIDAEIRANAPFIAHRAYFPSQWGTEAYQGTGCPEPGFTMGHLLTMLVRRQYDGWIRSCKRINNPAKIEEIVGATSIIPPGTAVYFTDLVIVAIRRSDGRNGRVRWFPQLEVAFSDISSSCIR
ncbi:hypothetical protein BC628DRAFT_418772 [Trametes gibbosa]|nr:hypothetical protein BC628DRAFT_418772 [Trametes gibbosa]